MNLRRIRIELNEFPDPGMWFNVYINTKLVFNCVVYDHTGYENDGTVLFEIRLPVAISLENAVFTFTPKRQF